MYWLFFSATGRFSSTVVFLIMLIECRKFYKNIHVIVAFGKVLWITGGFRNNCWRQMLKAGTTSLKTVSVGTSQSGPLLTTILPYSVVYYSIDFICSDLPLDGTLITQCLWWTISWTISLRSTTFSEGFWRTHCLKRILLRSTFVLLLNNSDSEDICSYFFINL